LGLPFFWEGYSVGRLKFWKGYMFWIVLGRLQMWEAYTFGKAILLGRSIGHFHHKIKGRYIISE